MDKKLFKKILSERVLILDGAMGTELHKRGFLADIGAPEELNLKFPERLKAVYVDYLKAGSEVILANTFGANSLKLKDYGLEGSLDAINQKAIEISRESAKGYNAFVAADIGPLGAYLSPLGTVEFEEAYDIFSQQVRVLAKASPDLIVIETMAEIREVKAAILAVKDNFSGPVIAQMTFTADGTSVTGTDLLTFVAVAGSMGADAIGLNCSVGPEELVKLARLLVSYTTLPVSFKPNAGMPRLINRETVFPGTPGEFLKAGVEAYKLGVNMLGGCCGTTPEFIKLLSAELKGKKPAARDLKENFLVSSRTKAVDLHAEQELVMVGERINPTNRKKFQDELGAGNFATIRREAQEQAKSGAKLLDINMGLPGADEKALMRRAVAEVQEAVQAPLCLDSSSIAALEEGLKACAGKPIINSVNGDAQRLDAVIPLVKRYGAALIGLCVDEKGLPKTSADRLVIAERILAAADKHGYPREEIIFDYLTLAASAMPEGIKETLAAIKESKIRWPKNKTILGVSNVSFGMPNRQLLNSTFLKLAREAGLDLAILNPHENWGLDDKAGRELLLGGDPKGTEYIKIHGNFVKKAPEAHPDNLSADKKLFNAVVEGSKEEVRGFVQQALAAGIKPLDIANGALLAALTEAGERFRKKEYFLPQVIMSAEAAQAAFAELKPLLKAEGSFKSGKIVLATVKGDVHDIGKNIVAAVLESHGWEVIDLGKNVEAKDIVEAAARNGAPVIGLSALMTTTMPEMEKVIEERNARQVKTKVLIGGAPVTEKYAKEIGADGYAKDAVAAADIAFKLL